MEPIGQFDFFTKQELNIITLLYYFWSRVVHKENCNFIGENDLIVIRVQTRGCTQWYVEVLLVGIHNFLKSWKHHVSMFMFRLYVVFFPVTTSILWMETSSPSVILVLHGLLV